MSSILYFDLETTGINPYTNEIITGYFEHLIDGEFVDSFLLQSQVNQWCSDAEKIHGISCDEMNQYQKKGDALDSLVEFLSGVSPFDACLFANPNTPLGFMYFDVATLQMELMNHLGVDRLEWQPFKPQNIINVYQLAKDGAKRGYFTPIKSSKGRVSYSQENIYAAIFNEKYNAHNCVDDVKAMQRIKDYLYNGTIKRSQLELI